MNKVTVSAGFRKRAWMAGLSILFFVFVYFLLFALAAAVAFCLGYLGVFLIAAKPMFATIAIGIALFAVGIFILAFMVKFMFSKNAQDNSGLIEINPSDEPLLCTHLRELTSGIGTPFPKRIFVSSQVNASVFYNSSFWSMFLPVRKNLHIGLGLANATTVSEFRGILAHEFGHFSQKSMKIGAYVYNVNRVIHNMLYENESYEQTVASWASKSGYFALVTWVAIYYSKMVQAILRKVHELVNLQHLALSREMEFHADAIAVNAVGTKPMVDAMLRLNLASEAMNAVLDHYNQAIERNKTSKNIFPNHSRYMHFIGENNGLASENGLPLVDFEEFKKFSKSKLNIKDQWASHPAEEERISRFIEASVHDVPLDNASANSLFSNLGKIQRELTKKLFEGITYSESPSEESIEEFEAGIQQFYLENSFPKVFNGYYAEHNPEPFELDAIADSVQSDWKPFFADQAVEQIRQTLAMASDAETINAIAEGRIPAKTFDYDGQKYSRKEAAELAANLKSQTLSAKAEIANRDKAIYAFFLKAEREGNKPAELEKAYSRLFELERNYAGLADDYIALRNGFAFAYETLQPEAIKRHLSHFYSLESSFKKSLGKIMQHEAYTNAISPEIQKIFEDYLNGNFTYFISDRYDEDAITAMTLARENFAVVLQRSYFLAKKKALDIQASLVPASEFA